jgi:hypothetical protein
MKNMPRGSLKMPTFFFKVLKAYSDQLCRVKSVAKVRISICAEAIERAAVSNDKPGRSGSPCDNSADSPVPSTLSTQPVESLNQVFPYQKEARSGALCNKPVCLIKVRALDVQLLVSKRTEAYQVTLVVALGTRRVRQSFAERIVCLKQQAARKAPSDLHL